MIMNIEGIHVMLREMRLSRLVFSFCSYQTALKGSNYLSLSLFSLVSSCSFTDA